MRVLLIEGDAERVAAAPGGNRPPEVPRSPHECGAPSNESQFSTASEPPSTDMQRCATTSSTNSASTQKSGLTICASSSGQVL